MSKAGIVRDLGKTLPRLAAMLALSGAATASPAVSAQTGANNEAWPYYGHDRLEQRFSPATEINRGNVAKLGLAWSQEVRSDRGQEATPIIANGVMYVSTAWSIVYAFDAATGRPLWIYDPKVPRESLVNLCCDAINRGAALLDGRVFVGTPDGRLVAIDAVSGKLDWQVDTLAGAPPSMHYSITGAVRVVKDKVVIGNAGGEFGVRGFVTAYDAASGKLAWRFYLTPAADNKPDGAASDTVLREKAFPTWGKGEWLKTGGGAPAWDGITYDPASNLVYIGTGNGGPFSDLYRDGGTGDDLFIASIVAVNADTGTYAWHYQATPGDSWDYDATQQIMGATLPIHGTPRAVVMQANKNGYFYILDANTGNLLSAAPFVPVTWSSGIDTSTGRPRVTANAHYHTGPVMLQPGPLGAHSWEAMSYSPVTGLVYIPASLTAGMFEKSASYQHRPMGPNIGITMPEFPEDHVKEVLAATSGELIAWDPIAQKKRWSVAKAYFENGGTLATAGALVFEGDIQGAFTAYDAENGQALWHFNADTAIIAPPVSYTIDGTQYIAVMSGFGGAGALIGKIVPNQPRTNGRVLVFKLGAQAALSHSPTVDLANIDVAGMESHGNADAGMAVYDTTCSVCHGANASVIYTADLRRSTALRDEETWKSIVIGGALHGQGMVSFASILTPEQAEDVRAYVLREAQKAATKK